MATTHGYPRIHKSPTGVTGSCKRKAATEHATLQHFVKKYKTRDPLLAGIPNNLTGDVVTGLCSTFPPPSGFYGPHLRTAAASQAESPIDPGLATEQRLNEDDESGEEGSGGARLIFEPRAPRIGRQAFFPWNDYSLGELFDHGEHPTTSGSHCQAGNDVPSNPVLVDPHTVSIPQGDMSDEGLATICAEGSGPYPDRMNTPYIVPFQDQNVGLPLEEIGGPPQTPFGRSSGPQASDAFLTSHLQNHAMAFPLNNSPIHAEASWNAFTIGTDVDSQLSRLGDNSYHWDHFLGFSQADGRLEILGDTTGEANYKSFSSNSSFPESRPSINPATEVQFDLNTAFQGTGYFQSSDDQQVDALDTYISDAPRDFGHIGFDQIEFSSLSDIHLISPEVPGGLSTSTSFLNCSNLDAGQTHRTARIRKPGFACGLCKECRSRCDLQGEVACSDCRRRAGNQSPLAGRLCLNYDVRAMEARDKLGDFFNAKNNSSRSRLLDRCFTSSITNGLNDPKGIRLLFRYPPIELKGIIHVSKGAVLRLLVHLCDDPFPDPVQTSSLNVVTATLPDSDDPLSRVYNNVPPDLSYHVVRGALPSIASLIKWGLQGVCWKSEMLANDVESCLDILLLQYASQSPHSDLLDVVRLTLKLGVLSRLFLVGRAPMEILQGNRRAVTNQYNGRHHSADNEEKFAAMSHPARNQLMMHVAKAFNAMEKELLEHFDRLVFQRQNGRGWTTSCSDPLILGLCVRRMSLHYRSYMLKYRQFGPSTRPRYERGQEMYDTMIRHYRHVFQGTLTPFHEEWKHETHQQALAHDERLMELFRRVKVAEEKHCQIELDPEVDGVYLKMILDKKDRKGNSLAKSYKLGTNSRAPSLPDVLALQTPSVL